MSDTLSERSVTHATFAIERRYDAATGDGSQGDGSQADERQRRAAKAFS